MEIGVHDAPIGRLLEVGRLCLLALLVQEARLRLVVVLRRATHCTVEELAARFIDGWID